jgi:hypothetical protein
VNVIIPPPSPDPDVLFPSLPPRLLTRFDSTYTYFNFVSSHCLLLVCAWVRFTVFAFYVLLLSLLPTKLSSTSHIYIIRHRQFWYRALCLLLTHYLDSNNKTPASPPQPLHSIKILVNSTNDHSIPNDDISTESKINCDWPIGLNKSTHHTR